MRTRPAQKNADSAPGQDQVTRPPMTAGSSDRGGHDQREELVDAPDVLVGHQVWGEPLLVGQLAVEQPADVGVPQSLGQAPERLAVAPRRVRVALHVAELVVPAVVGHPLGRRALDRHAAGHGQRDAQPALGLERAVGEVAVEADADAEPADRCRRSRRGRRRSSSDPSPTSPVRRRPAPRTGCVTNSHSAIRMPGGCLPVVSGLGVGPAGSVAAGSTTAVVMGTSSGPVRGQGIGYAYVTVTCVPQPRKRLFSSHSVTRRTRLGSDGRDLNPIA